MIHNKCIIIFTLICITAVNFSNGARILSVYSTYSRSHFIVAETLLIELAKRGHNVTVISLYSPPNPIPNYRHIELKYKHPDVDDAFQKFVDNSGDIWYSIKGMQTLLDIGVEYVKAILEMPEMVDLMNEEFDLLIYEGAFADIFLGLAAHFKCPTVIINSFEPIKTFNDLVGNPSPESYVPSIFIGYKGSMTFPRRVLSFLANLVFTRIFDGNSQRFTSLYKEKFPSSKYPSYDEMKKNISLALINYHFTQGNPRPLVPAIVEVGGLQVKEVPNPLPQELKDWIDGAEHGIVYLSFGSNVKGNSLSPDKLNHIKSTFAKLKQRVIWKFDDESIKLPSNVRIWKWLPQDDLLAHPNLKLFITHGGLGSILEARVRGVPIVGIPIFGDQMANIKGCEKEGWAIALHYNDLTEVTFSSAISEVLNNSKYRETVHTISKLYLDRPMSPMKTAIFWIEYVLRHRGAKHMQAHSVHLNWIELHSYDVIGFLLFMIVISLTLLFFIIRCIIRSMCRRISKSKFE